MLQSSRPDLEVVGVFNPAAIRQDGDVVLLVRVAEAPRDVHDGMVEASVAARVELALRARSPASFGLRPLLSYHPRIDT